MRLRRALAPTTSDSRAEVDDEVAARFEPVVELPPAEHGIWDTAQDVMQLVIDQFGPSAPPLEQPQ